MLHEDSGDDSNEEHESWSQNSADVTVAYPMDESEGDSEVTGSQDSCSLPTVLKELHFWYIDPDGRKVLNKDQAAVTINGMSNVDLNVIKVDACLPLLSTSMCNMQMWCRLVF